MDPNAISAIAASVSAFVASIALFAASFQVYYLRKQISQDHDWKRREKALLYSQFYYPDIRDARARLSSKLGNVQARVPWKELEKKIAEDRTIRDDMQTLLIHIENMGLAVHHNVADFIIIYDIGGTDIIRFCEIFYEYIDVTRGGNPRIWQNVDGLKDRLLLERDTRHKVEAERTASKPIG